MSAAELVRLLLLIAFALAGMATWASRTTNGRVVVLGAALGAIATGAADLDAGQTSRAVSALEGVALGGVMVASFWLLVSLPASRPSSVRVPILSIVAFAGLAVGGLSISRSGELRALPLVSIGSVLAVFGVVIANSRYRRASPIEQRSLRWYGVAALASLSIAGAIGVVAMLGWRSHAGVALAATTATVPLCMVMADRQRLLPAVDRVVELLCTVMAVVSLSVTVVAIVVAAQARPLTAEQRQPLLIAALGFAVAAAVGTEVRRRVIRQVRVVAHGSGAASADPLTMFHARLTRAVPLQELLQQLCETMRASSQLESVEVWMLSAGHLATVAASPHRRHLPVEFDDRARSALLNTRVTGGSWTEIWMPAFVSHRPATNVRIAPLVHASEVLGVLACERSPSGDPFTENFDDELREIGRSVSVSLHNLRLDSALQASLAELQARNAELVESRSRIVAAGDAQRRRIERDLHDGAQQRLTAMALKLRVLGDALRAHEPGAGALVAEMDADLRDAILELRTLAHGIFPPLLVSSGLGPALSATAARSPIAVEVSCSGRRHGAPLEAAVYFCCLEAMQNAAKHAGDSARVSLRVWEDETVLCFEVVDDGVGFDTVASLHGHGFSNMADRVGALGGSLTIDSSPGAGTRVAGRLPIAED